MTAPNLIASTTINGKSTGVALSTTSETSVLDNASSSGKVFKINTLNVSNTTGTAASITINLHTAASLGGTALAIAGSISVPAYSTLNLIDKTTQYYIEEDQSIGATAGTSNALVVTISYEDIS